jgi:hypothetical protein
MADETTTGAGAQTAGEAGQTTNAPADGTTGTGPVMAATGGMAEAGQPKPGEKTFTQADIDKIIKARLDEEKRKVEQKRAKEAGEWQTLAQQHEQDLTATRTEFESVKAQVEKYSQAVQAMYAARVKGLTPAARKAVESLPISDPLDRLAWLDANADLFTAAQPPNINATERSGQRPDTLSVM